MIAVGFSSRTTSCSFCICWCSWANLSFSWVRCSRPWWVRDRMVRQENKKDIKLSMERANVLMVHMFFHVERMRPLFIQEGLSSSQKHVRKTGGMEEWEKRGVTEPGGEEEEDMVGLISQILQTKQIWNRCQWSSSPFFFCTDFKTNLWPREKNKSDDS